VPLQALHARGQLPAQSGHKITLAQSRWGFAGAQLLGQLCHARVDAQHALQRVDQCVRRRFGLFESGEPHLARLQQLPALGAAELLPLLGRGVALAALACADGGVDRHERWPAGFRSHSARCCCPLVANAGFAMRCFALIVLTPMLLLGSPVGQAQGVGDTAPKSGITPPPPRVDPNSQLYMQADQLMYDTQNSRVVAQGNVEMYYNNFVLTADQVVYDQRTNKLVAEGNAQLKDPNGAITRAERLEMLDDFRDLSIVDKRIVPR
jgi:hypothetical protein